MNIYVALLRGINVGGHNKIKMADLRESLKELGLSNVQTYIQSGNIIFASSESEASLRERIEQQIEKTFGLSIRVIIRSYDELKRIVENCPFTEQQIAEAVASCEGECLYVSMLLQQPDAERIDKLRAMDLQNDQFQIVDNNIYLLYGKSVRNSKLSVQVEKLGVPSTVRNWKTMNKLVTLCDEMAMNEVE
ncbi:DUF1697 domain-containing protein [Paenibacillus radicis (ex Gao et al. 2016)]|uniref:Cytoplasmic protein n=1 Tax=Paenibacillus radicis (ex Gao et al. 2016) TaxID=1737354 RepID=A0A917GRD0_9BACL|nr:DUF1697 domain-containing protein [Paenibacillus radicis (ex Gao et al. 2016)]GGG54384.1 hypothetical protein GCM10010918_04010 [Paenibacillus radicis (ex Gao et al. 2016)]